MQQPIVIKIEENLVNYTNVSTSVSNEVFIVSTETPDSLSFLMRNQIIYGLSITQEVFVDEPKSTSVIVY